MPSPGPSPLTAEHQHPRRILLVGDERGVLDELRGYLQGHRDDWTPSFADGADRAREILRAELQDAVVADVDLPGRDGLELLREIRADERTRDVPVVILTGKGEHDVQSRALDLGATDLLMKPVLREELIARLRSVLRTKEFRDELEEANRLLEQRVRERTAELEQARVELIWRLGRAGEFRDSETGLHVVRVGFFSRRIAQALGLDDATVQSIFLTSPLHDIGKIRIPDAILLRDGRLEGEDWDLMQRHTRIGASLLRDDPFRREGPARAAGEVPFAHPTVLDSPLLDMAADIAEYHHERWDGTGYPEGLAGNDIPLPARITAVADVYDALRSSRPYKVPLSEEEVLGIMRSGIRRHFDPAVLHGFEDALLDLQKIGDRYRDQECRDLQADSRRELMELRDAS